MKNQVKTFNQFVNEDQNLFGDSKKGVARVTLEFDWTWADQKDEEEAREATSLALMKLPKGIEIDGYLELDGWDRDDATPDYSTPYLVELTLAFRGDRDSFTAELSAWLESTQLLELYGIDFN